MTNDYTAFLHFFTYKSPFYIVMSLFFINFAEYYVKCVNIIRYNGKRTKRTHKAC